MRKDTHQQFDWSGSIEQLEDRLVMSADPLGGFLGGSVQQHTLVDDLPQLQQQVVAEQPPALEHQIESLPDFWISSEDQTSLEEELRQIEQQLNNVLGSTAIDQIQSNYGFTGAGQTVAVIDSGIAYDHSALGGGFGANYRVVGGWDFTGENDADPYDDGPSGGHGTHVAGIIGGTDNGVAPGVDLVALRVFDDAGAGYFSWVENALDWIHDNKNSFENPITAVNLSLGVATWNSDAIPNWANLEDEFAHLEADGIFISVSAGNSFSSFNTTGLSYPAASQYVVPVASVDSSGLLSYFSQRNSRVIAAPGRGITSTVPDYKGDNNGVVDDYASFSGTSMAAPYVAGASVLIREAMEFVGYTNITQDTIYDHMIATADSFFDSATNAYYNRLNLEAAIDALMPEDDYGSTLATAYNLGTISDSISTSSASNSMSGAITTLDDIDYFKFTAASTGTVTFTASNMTYNVGADWDVNGGTSTWSGTNNEILTIDVVAGQEYTVGFSSNDGLGYYDLGITAESSFSFTDWGSISFSELQGVSVAGETWYRVAANATGYFTTEALFDSAGGQINLELYNSSLQLIDSGNATGGESRVDYYGAAGDELYIKAIGTNADVDFRLTNLVSVVGTTVNVAGTAGDDAFSFAAGNTHQISVNGTTYSFASIAISDIQFNGGAGADSITFTGTTGNDSATLLSNFSLLSGSGYTTWAANTEDVSIYGGGGTDTAYFYDSAGDDVYRAYADRAVMTTANQINRAYNFQRTFAFANGGGTDQAYLYDGATNDLFVGQSTYALLQSSTGEFSNYTSAFESVTAYSTAGGTDISYLYDGASNDEFIAHPDYSYLRGLNNEFYNRAEGFSQVYAFSTAGGTDEAHMYDGATDDQFIGAASYSLFRGNSDEFYNYSNGFEKVFAYATAGGDDYAYLYDGASDDEFIGRSDYSQLRGVNGEFYTYAENFDRVYAFTSVGLDEAYLYDSVGDDQFIGEATYSQLNALNGDFFNFANGFDRVYAYATSGGNDTANFYDSSGRDFFFGSSSYSYLLGLDSGHLNQATGFDRVYAFSNAGGVDEAHLYDSTSNDVLYGRQGYAFISTPGVLNFTSGFESVFGYSENGGTDRTDVDAVDYLFSEIGSWS